MIKKILVSTLVFSSIAVGMLVFAQTSGTPADTQSQMLSCTASAVATRETAIQSAFGIYSTAMTAAFTARASALASAWAITDKAARNTAIKAAWSTFKQAKETAKRAHNTSVKSAWSNFVTARKACKAPATGENPGVDNI